MNYIDAEIVKGTKKYKISNNELTGTSLEVLSLLLEKSRSVVILIQSTDV